MIHRRPIKWLVLVGLVTMLDIGRVAPARAQATTVTSQSRFTGTGEFFDECNGEFVEVTFTVNSVFHVTEDPAGGFHFTSVGPAYGTAVGMDSGNEYQFSFTFNLTLYNGGPLPFTFTVQNQFHFISLGRLPNLVVKALFHMTINANGEGTAFLDSFRSVCHG